MGRTPSSVQVCHGRFNEAGSAPPRGHYPRVASRVPVAPVVPGYVGIDVGRASLVLATSTTGTVLPRRRPNTAAGIARASIAGALEALAATGAYHRPLVATLAAGVSGVPTAVV